MNESKEMLTKFKKQAGKTILFKRLAYHKRLQTEGSQRVSMKGPSRGWMEGSQKVIDQRAVQSVDGGQSEGKSKGNQRMKSGWSDVNDKFDKQ